MKYSVKGINSITHQPITVKVKADSEAEAKQIAEGTYNIIGPIIQEQKKVEMSPKERIQRELDALNPFKTTYDQQRKKRFFM